MDPFSQPAQPALTEAVATVAPLLRDLPEDIREALRRWYGTNQNEEEICGECDLKVADFSTVRNSVREQFNSARQPMKRTPGKAVATAAGRNSRRSA